MLSSRFAKFIDKCFGYRYFQKYKFNYGDGKYETHKIFRTALPLYIQRRHKLYEKDWMGYVKLLVDRVGEEGWFNARCSTYGTVNESYCVLEYHQWSDVVCKKGAKDCVRIKNDGPDDSPVDVFWIRLIDYAYNFDDIEDHDASAHELKPLFLATVWFYLCERPEALDYLQCTKNNHLSPYVC
jgi:hypothetical protein